MFQITHLPTLIYEMNVFFERSPHPIANCTTSSWSPSRRERLDDIIASCESKLSKYPDILLFMMNEFLKKKGGQFDEAIKCRLNPYKCFRDINFHTKTSILGHYLNCRCHRSVTARTSCQERLFNGFAVNYRWTHRLPVTRLHRPPRVLSVLEERGWGGRGGDFCFPCWPGCR